MSLSAPADARIALLALVLASCATASTTGPSVDPDAQFAYDARAPLDVTIAVAEAIPGGTIAALSFASPMAGRASGFLALPSGRGPFSAVVLMPGSNAPPSVMRPAALDLVQRGAAALAIDQTQTRPGHRPLFTFTVADRDEAVATVIDLRRTLDLLATRPEIDTKRVGYWGFSHGAFLGGILSGVDHRIRAYVLQSGGGADYLLQNAPRNIADPEALARYRAAIASIDPVAYVGRAAPAALLFQNGNQDRTYSDAGVAAWVAAGSAPKEIKRYPADHPLDTRAHEDALAFLRAALGLAGR